MNTPDCDKYYNIAGMVDVVFADVAQPDQARIVALNAHHFLKNQGHFVMSIKVTVLCSVLCGASLYCVVYVPVSVYKYSRQCLVVCSEGMTAIFWS